MIEVSSTFQLFVVFMIILYIIKRPRIGKNEPPFVPYTIPILGHTYDYLFNTKKFLKECKEKYGDCFSIYIFGEMVTILSRDSLTEVFRNHNDFDMSSATRETFPLNRLLPYGGNNIPFHAKTAREQVSGKLDINIDIAQKYLLEGMEKLIGDCNEPKVFYKTWKLVNCIIALPIANILVGEEAASHEDLVKSLGDLAFDVGPLIIIPPILFFIHKKLHEIVVTLPFKFGWSPISRHRNIVKNRLSPVVEKRLKERKELGDNYKPYNDLLEYYMNQPDFDITKPNNLLYHIDNLFAITFASINTTSRAAVDALYDLAGRPELLNELYEEALTIDKECNGLVTLTEIQKMVKLDSFVKESLRFGGNLITLPHYVISKSYTFSNGFTVPGGRMTMLYTNDMLMAKESFGDDAEEFKPFRFLNRNSPATKVDRSYIVFGGGKHACPGRFFAINETKLFLHKVIMKYKVSTESGKIEDKMLIGPSTSPSQGGLVFENRVKNN
ncbi:cytochrome P450 [Rhizophagus irregularis]|uniref:Cytochrome P450 n=1 Tax=Rhizophagus irregularis TaxID=588596 RepID=A0A2N0RTI1_9GLOM|nr:cytochrome P450 [Rhizophagus irregularis]PKC66617.1 cytochrome P450 [Rhizophagus irregularis]